jgi:hypothetical protein
MPDRDSVEDAMPAERVRKESVWILRLTLAMAAGLWASTVLPGVDLSGESLGTKAVALLGTGLVSSLLWSLAELGNWLFKLAKKRTGLSIKITTEKSLAFPFTGMSISPVPGLQVEVDDVEVSGRIVDALGRFLRRLLAFASLLVIFLLQFWFTAWLAGRLGLAFKVTGFWPVLGGTLVTNAICAPLTALRLERTPVTSPRAD